jgi:hypothetical protein
MKNHFVTCLGLLCLACSMKAQVASAQPKVSSPLEQALIIAEKKFVEAAKKGDVGFFKRTLTDDFSFVGIDGQLGDRQAMVDQYSEAGQNLQPYGMKVVTAGDDAAIVTYDAVVQVPPVHDQGPPPRYQHFSTVWVKQGDAWKMKFQQTTAAHWGDW